MSKFLFGEQELDSAVEALLNRSQECNGEVLYIGPVIRPVFSKILERLENNAGELRVRFVLPALTGKDFHGSSFLYNFQILAEKARVESDARDTLLISRDCVLFINDKAIREGTISAIEVKNKAAVAQMNYYFEKIWDNAAKVLL